MPTKPILASRYTCTGCMACVDICPTNALEVVEKKDGHLYVDWKNFLCISCGACTKSCSIVNGYDYSGSIEISIPFIGWAKNDKLREKSASGGAFAAIADHFIRNGWYVAGAIQDKFTVSHLITNRIEDIEKLQNSKYQQGYLTGVYKQAKHLLNQGNRLLFSGTPCQIAGLYSFLGTKDYSNNLFTIDLVCSGFTSTLPLKAFLTNEPINIDSISYRNKEKGWVDEEGKIVCQRITATTSKGKVDYGKNFIYSAFFSHLTIRHSCLDCRFALLTRKSDITLADFWGDKGFPKEHIKGISAIICHSKKGIEVVNAAEIEFYPTEWGKILFKNYRLAVGKFRFYKYHPTRFLYPYIFKYCSYSFIKEIFGGKQKNILWFPYKAFGSIIYKVSTYYLKKDLKRIIYKRAI